MNVFLLAEERERERKREDVDGFGAVEQYIGALLLS